MDWIHCNSCFVQLAPGVSLHLTSCGHMFCQSCLESGAKSGKCKVCLSPCTTMQLAPDMTPDVQDFFSEPEELLNKLSGILDFQRKHRMRLTSYWINIAKKFTVAKDEVKRLNMLCHKLNDAVKELQQKNKILKAQLKDKQTIDESISPFQTALSPSMNIISPTLTPQTQARPAKSTPYSNIYQSSLVTPARISKTRPNSGPSQRLNGLYKGPAARIPSPSSPASAGSGYYSGSPFKSSTSPDMYGSVVGVFRRNKCSK